MKVKKNIFLFGFIALAAAITFSGCATNSGGGGTGPGGRGDITYTDIAVPVGIQTLAAALDWISENAMDGGAYTVTLKADESAQSRGIGYGDKRVSITLRGDTAERTVSLSGTGSLFNIDRGVTLNVENLTLKGRGNSESAANDSPLVRVNSGGVLKLKADAVITENYNSEYGGGVGVGENAVFIMEGGAIHSNTAKGHGGVDVWKGTFTMEGGEISGNTAANESTGGVSVSENATFTMKGGTISGNTARDNGGGVSVSKNATFTMKGGTISGNTAKWGGGVGVGEKAAFTMEGGEISGNTAKGSGGVSVGENATFTMKGGKISGNTATEWDGGVQVGEKAAFTMEGGTISGNTAKGSGGVSVGENATFTMKGGEISGNTATEWDCGGVGVGEKATFIMEGGTISGNTAKSGGGVNVVEKAAFTMEDGEISGNTAYNGGGVRLSGTFTMKGGKISGNTAKRGGGVDSWEGTFTMEGGEISGNTTTTTTESGGGIWFGGEKNTPFTKTGGTIYGDTDTSHTPGSAENTALNGNGHAVWLDPWYSNAKRRNATAGPDVKLYAKRESENGGWIYIDSSSGGVGDTTANWE